MNKKAVYLVLALVLPGMFFLFLRFFGRNQFDIPIYYSKGVTNTHSSCPKSSQGQYFLPDSLLAAIRWSGGVLLFTSNTTVQERNDLERLSAEPKLGYIQIIRLDEMEERRAERWKACVLFLTKPWDAVLIDGQKRIRGYYALSTREERDRLNVELEILHNKY